MLINYSYKLLKQKINNNNLNLQQHKEQVKPNKNQKPLNVTKQEKFLIK